MTTTTTTTTDHPLFPTSSHLFTTRPESSTSFKSRLGPRSGTTTTTTSTTPTTTPPRSCRRPSPLRNNSFCSDDLDNDVDKRNKSADEEEAMDGMTSSFCESIDETDEAHQTRRRDSGSEVEDAVGGSDDKSSLFERHVPASGDKLALTAPGHYTKALNYNPSSTTITTTTSKPSSFTRPKPLFPRSTPLRPLTLALSPATTTTQPPIGSGARYSTPHAGMIGKSSAAAGQRQKVIVPKKGWKMSFDLGLTQSELAREA